MLQTFTNFAAEEASGSGLSALGVDGKAFLIQLITFLLVFWVLKRWAFAPILKVLNERRETIESGVKLGEQMRQEKSAFEAQTEEMLAKARQQADGIIAGAQDSGREAIREAEEKARAKAEGIITAAEGRLEQDTARARQALEKEVASLVASATEAVIGEKVDAKKDAALIERSLKGQGA
jgi:F-type H+-transporting ATPase subunit b